MDSRRNLQQINYFKIKKNHAFANCFTWNFRRRKNDASQAADCHLPPKRIQGGRRIQGRDQTGGRAQSQDSVLLLERRREDGVLLVLIKSARPPSSVHSEWSVQQRHSDLRQHACEHQTTQRERVLHRRHFRVDVQESAHRGRHVQLHEFQVTSLPENRRSPAHADGAL